MKSIREIFGGFIFTHTKFRSDPVLVGFNIMQLIFFSISATVSQSSEIIFSAAILTIFCLLKVLAEYKPDKTNPVHAVIFSSD